MYQGRQKDSTLFQVQTAAHNQPGQWQCGVSALSNACTSARFRRCNGGVATSWQLIPGFRCPWEKTDCAAPHPTLAWFPLKRRARSRRSASNGAASRVAPCAASFARSACVRATSHCSSWIFGHNAQWCLGCRGTTEEFTIEYYPDNTPKDGFLVKENYESIAACTQEGAEPALVVAFKGNDGEIQSSRLPACLCGLCWADSCNRGAMREAATVFHPQRKSICLDAAAHCTNSCVAAWTMVKSNLRLQLNYVVEQNKQLVHKVANFKLCSPLGTTTFQPAMPRFRQTTFSLCKA